MCSPTIKKKHHQSKQIDKKMDGWTALLLTQEDLRSTTIDQYFTLQAINQCAIALGAAPVSGVTLHTDVLGQTVFSALGKNVVAGAGPGRRRRSEEEQRKFMQTIIGIVDRTANVAANMVEVSSNEKLTKGEKTEKILSYIGGPFGALSIAAGVYRFVGTQKESSFLKYVHDWLKALPIDVKSNKVDDVKRSLDAVQTKYKSMEKNQTEAIEFLNKHLLVDSQTFQRAIQGDDYKEAVPVLLSAIDNDNFDWTDNKLGRALFIWTQTVLGAFEHLVEPSKKIEWPIDANVLNARVQEKLTPLLQEFDKKFAFKATQAAQVAPAKVGAGGDVSEVCGRITEAFRRDSVATRLLLEALLVVPQP
jgi:hypothetical protein